MSRSLRVLLGGGSGFVGSALRAHLASRGHHVDIVSRSSSRGSLTWSQLSSGGSALPAGLDAVVNLSGLNVQNLFMPWCSSKTKQELIDSRVDTTHTLLRAIAGIDDPQQRPNVFIGTSAIGAYPNVHQPRFDEYTPPEQLVQEGNFANEICRRTEEAAGALRDETPGLRRCVVRVGLVMGDGGGTLAAMKPAFQMCLGGRLGSGEQWMPWVHMDDVVGLYTHLIENPAHEGVFNAVAPQETTNAQFTAALGSALGRPAVIPVPSFVLKLALGAHADMLLNPPSVAPTRTLEAGYEFRHADVVEALRSLCS